MRLRLVLPILASQAILAGSASGQTTVSGVVHDSVAGRPLARATVQLIHDSSRAARTLTSDASGAFSFPGVPDGEYTLGFFHAMLDSLGLDPVLRVVEVRGQGQLQADLAIPSPQRIRASICGPRRAGSGAVVMGIVRNAGDGVPAPGVPITVEWVELRLKTRGAIEERPRMTDVSRDNGWFALCDVPSPGTIALMTGEAGDSTARIVVDVPLDGFLRRDLYLGAPGSEMDALSLSGTIVTADGVRPVADALVSVAGGQATRSDASGHWTVTAPSGTRMLEVRAIGYYPAHRAIDVVANTPAQRIELFTMRAMLDTIRVTASRLTTNLLGFEERRRSGQGQYLTAEWIERRRAQYSSQVFRMVSGIDLVKTETQGTLITMRNNAPADLVLPETSISALMDRCVPSFYLDGGYVGSLSADDLDAFVNPDDIAGIEIYREPNVPGQFRAGALNGGCGAVAVWTRPQIILSTASWKKRAFRAAAFLGAGLLAGRLVFLVMD